MGSYPSGARGFAKDQIGKTIAAEENERTGRGGDFTDESPPAEVEVVHFAQLQKLGSRDWVIGGMGLQSGQSHPSRRPRLVAEPKLSGKIAADE